MSILAFGDLHLGLKAGYSSQLDSGFVSSEAEAIKAMDYILERSSKDDIDIIIFTGDLTHTNHPTNLVTEKIQDWIIAMDGLNKPVYLITGNHDLSTYSHSFSFITPLIQRGLLHNIHLIDNGVCNINYGTHQIWFVPFVWGEATEKYKTVQESIRDILAVNKSNVMIVSHFQESNAASGSEAAMISKSTEKFDLDETVDKYNNVQFLLGHIHQYQQYTKQNGIKVCYTGNPYYHDKTDCNKPKGFVTIDDDMNIKFETVPGLLKFNSYSIPVGTDPETFFASTRTFPNTVVYVENNIDNPVDAISDYTLSKILTQYNVKLADVKNVLVENSTKVVVDYTGNKDFRETFRDAVKATYNDNPFSDEKLKAIFNVGDDLLTEAGYTK